MASPARGLESKALKLSRWGRARLAQRLLSSLDQDADAGAEQLWIEEAKRRLGQLKSGKVVGIPAEKVIKQVREAFAGVFKRFPDANFGDARHFVAGDRGVSEWLFTGTTSDGKKLEVNGCDVFTFKGDKIAVKNSYFKTRIA
jgi:putative addiction module component (TIGR02574 family)